MPSSGQILRGYVVVYGCGRTLAPAGVAVTVAVRHFWIYAGLLAGVADGCGVQLHPALSISAVANPLAGSLTSCLLAGTGIRLLFHADRFTLVSGNILLVSCF